MFRILILCAAIATFSDCAYNKTEKLEVFFKDCQTKTGASQEDFEAIKQRRIPDTPEGLCMVECIFSKLKIFRDGKFNKNGMVLTFTPVLKGDMGKVKKLNEVATKCEKEVATKRNEKCQMVRTLIDCFSKYGNDLGLANQ
uniref:Odorant binding protein 28 n=1 Tax=Cylas formicarius TaxID=197179 RepID=A0A8T9EEJ6_CYLFO|nr:odorant binding protein 28 [Cylas formicarius]